MAVEELMGSLQAYEQRILKKSEGRTLEQALKAKLLFKQNESLRGGHGHGIGRGGTQGQGYGRGRNTGWRIEDITPEEAWSLCKPKVDHLRTIGSITYAKVQEEKRTKLEDKSQKYILLGYFENASGYKLYNPITQKLMVSRDMKFDEEQAWNWNNNNDDDMKQISFEEDYKDKQGESEVVSSPQQVDTQSESDEPNSPIVKKIKSIQDIYDSS
ncbi:hypothetical protein ZIOFF_062537 [Zingiber officinale]|uniref:Retroviral polymerase SH3-like domain-containing protein n=1 Tax=Zingiber officinale TaxID=94328 RepID=A0A8J5F576_ZINOF|nr:hypothetical protein ZIOFF_062537 [Zingiber officinale]